MNRATLLAAALALAAPLPARAGVTWFQGSLEQALAEARAQRKVVLFDAWANWCKYCHVLDRELWSRDEVGRQLALETVPFRAEVDEIKRVGMDLRARYSILALPVVLLLDPADGQVLERIDGYHTAETLFAALDRARIRAFPDAALAVAGEDPEALTRAGAELARGGNFAAADRSFARALALDADCAKDRADETALALADMQESRGDAAAAARAVDDGLARCAKASSAPELWARRIVLAERTGGEAARGEVLVRRAERLPDDATAQREAAEWLAGGGGDPRAAARLAARALELAPDDPLALAAMARVELALGTPRKALELVEKAIRIDPHDPQLRELRLRIALAAAESREAGP